MIHIEVIQGTQAGRSWDFTSGSVTVGRDRTNDLSIEDIHVSSVHCRIEGDPSGWIVEDLGSTNGTAILRGEERIVLGRGPGAKAPLTAGDVILVGSAGSPVALLVAFAPRVEAGEPGAQDADDSRIVAVARIAELLAVHQQVQRDPDLLARLYAVLSGIRWELSLQQVMSATRAAVLDLLPRATHLCLALRDPASGALVPMLAASRGGDVTPEAFSLSHAIVARVEAERAAVMVANAPVEVGETASIMGAGILSTIAAPLWRGDEFLGVLQVDNRDSPGIFGRVDLDLVLVVASQASLALLNAELYEKLLLAESKLEGENSYLKTLARERKGVVVGSSPAMRQVFQMVAKVKDTPVSVLVLGETGTGKEIVASAVHYGSARAERLFVALNCAAMPESLLESELFGYRRGAFTGADRDKKGLFAVADGGTLFLDEIGDLPPSMQAKLLRVLQEGEIRPLGSSKAQRVDVRLIAATNRDLSKEVQEGRFREDLFYRLNVFPIVVPPLRERREDIAGLANHFLDRYSREFCKRTGGLGQDLVAALTGYDWPGNVRELENEIQRVVIALEEGQIATADLLSPHVRRVASVAGKAAPPTGTLRERMEEVERWILLQALDEHGGNKSETARTLGISREGLHKKLARFGIK